MADEAPTGLVCVAKCLDISEAHILLSRLDSAGIPAVLFDEHLAQTAWHYSFAMGGVRVMVPAIHEVEARALFDLGLPIEPEDGEACPNCSSHDVARLYSWASLPLSLGVLLAVPFMLRRRRRKCRNCGHAWRV